MSTLRASVTAQAGGVNYMLNPALLNDTANYTTTSNGGSDLPTLSYDTFANLPADDPIGENGGAGILTWTGPNADGALPPGLVPTSYNITADMQVTISVYVYVPQGSVPVVLVADSVVGTSSGGLHDTWVRLQVTITASVADPAIAVWPDGTASAGQFFYFTGWLAQPGAILAPWTLGGGQAGDDAQVLIDGSDTPVSANGLPDYLPSPGDRLLVQRVGSVIEIVQFLSRGTVPYLQNSDLSDLQAQVDSNTQTVADTSDYASATNTDLQNYKGTTDATLSTFQLSFDVLNGIGNVGVEEDYIWVGDDPALSTVKSVQISTYVQAGLAATTSQALSTYFNLVALADMGDIEFSSTDPPMTTFYTKFTDAGLSAVPWNG